MAFEAVGGPGLVRAKAGRTCPPVKDVKSSIHTPGAVFDLERRNFSWHRIPLQIVFPSAISL